MNRTNTVDEAGRAKPRQRAPADEAPATCHCTIPGSVPRECRLGCHCAGLRPDQYADPDAAGGEGLRRAGLREGMRFLDVAAGSGALAIPAARAGARVTAIDRSPVMLEHLRRRAHDEGLAIDTRVMDGHALAFPDDTFDMAGSQFGVMLFPDMPRALAEMARVVRPGGRVLVHAYGDPHRIDFLGFLVGAVQSVRPGFRRPAVGSRRPSNSSWRNPDVSAPGDAKRRPSRSQVRDGHETTEFKDRRRRCGTG